MTKVNKTAIKAKLAEYVSKYDSQTKAANSLKGVSPATISQILNGNVSQISNDMWLNIAAGIGYTGKQWTRVKTVNYKKLHDLYTDAAENGNVFGVIGDAGCSKSEAAKGFVEGYKRAYRLECNEYWNRKLFLQELLAVVGRDWAGLNVHELVQELVRTIKSQECPVIILDEFDKVNDQVLYFFITLYNQLQGECGLVLQSTDYFKKRIERGIRLNKKGYREVFSRIGRKFIELKSPTSTDIQEICRANGITKQADIEAVLYDCEGDLRRVERKVHALKKKAA